MVFTIVYYLQVLHGTPRCVALTPSCSTLFVGCLSGILQRFDVSPLKVRGAKGQYHGNTPHGISAIAVLGEDSLITADCDGIMHAMIVTNKLKDKLTAHGSSGSVLHDQNSVSPKPQGGVFDISDKAMAGLEGVDMVATQVLPIDEVLQTILSKV